jgi:hypothetical protein
MVTIDDPRANAVCVCRQLHADGLGHFADHPRLAMIPEAVDS